MGINILVIFVVFCERILAYDNPMASACQLKLLDDPNVIPDSAFSQSSAYDSNFEAKAARESFNREAQEYAWCPKPMVGRELSEYMEIDLGEVYVIRLILTKGRGALGQGNQYTPNYFVDYKREARSSWMKYRNYNGTTKLEGNRDPFLESLQQTSPPLIARWIRIFPYSDVERKVCMKIELYGCLFTDKVLEYRIPDGNFIPSTTHPNRLLDSTYDGNRSQSANLSGGLGKLLDHDIESASNSPQSEKSVRFVGWEQQMSHPPMTRREFVPLVFVFINVRQFINIYLYVTNHFEVGMALFSRLEARFSIGGVRFDQQTPIEYNQTRDDRNRAARWVRVSLDNRIGRFVELRLFFGSNWVVLSEVKFDSVPLNTTAIPEPLFPNEGSTLYPPISDHQQSSSGANLSSLPRKPVALRTTYALIIICILLFGLVVTGIVGLVIVRRRKCRRRRKLSKQQDSSNVKRLQEEQFGFLTYAHDQRPSIMTTSGMVQVDLFRGHPCLTINGRPLPESYAYTSLPGSDTESNCPSSNQYAAVLPSSLGGWVSQQMPAGIQTLSTSAGHNGLPGVEYSSSLANMAFANQTLPAGAFVTSPPPTLYKMSSPGSETPSMSGAYPTQPARLGHCTLPGPQTSAPVPGIQGVTGSSTYWTPPDIDRTPPTNPAVNRLVSRDQLCFLEKLGEGQFGEVHLAELRDEASSGGSQEEEELDGVTLVTGFGPSHQEDGSSDGLAEDGQVHSSDSTSDLGSSMPGRRLVVVQLLRREAPEHARLAFHQSLQQLARLTNPNLAQLIAIGSDMGVGVEGHIDPPPSLLTHPSFYLAEYARYGDLHQFLQSHYSPDVASNLGPLPPNTRTLSHGTLVYLAVQIASAMKYLESQHVVHRDLACRNCLIGPQYRVKVASLAMARRQYTTDYFRVDGRHLHPVRWMAWESLLQGRYTSKSDVWAFGVTMWEVLTYCRELPFSQLTNKQVMLNASLLANGDDSAHQLPAPSNCPKEIVDFLLQTWQRDEARRPSFLEIHMFLQHKNLGYQPVDEEGLVGGVSGCGKTTPGAGPSGSNRIQLSSPSLHSLNGTIV